MSGRLDLSKGVHSWLYHACHSRMHRNTAGNAPSSSISTQSRALQGAGPYTVSSQHIEDVSMAGQKHSVLRRRAQGVAQNLNPLFLKFSLSTRASCVAVIATSQYSLLTTRRNDFSENFRVTPTNTVPKYTSTLVTLQTILRGSPPSNT